jgi:hypothetical protein
VDLAQAGVAGFDGPAEGGHRIVGELVQPGAGAAHVHDVEWRAVRGCQHSCVERPLEAPTLLSVQSALIS